MWPLCHSNFNIKKKKKKKKPHIKTTALRSRSQCTRNCNRSLECLVQGVFSSKFREQEVSKTNIKGFCKWRHLSAVTYLLLESANSRWLSLVILPPECLSLQEGPANCDIRSGKHGAFRSQTSVETLRKAKWMSDIFLKSPKGKCSVPSKFPLLSTES